MDALEKLAIERERERIHSSRLVPIDKIVDEFAAQNGFTVRRNAHHRPGRIMDRDLDLGPPFSDCGQNIQVFLTQRDWYDRDVDDPLCALLTVKTAFWIDIGWKSYLRWHVWYEGVGFDVVFPSIASILPGCLADLVESESTDIPQFRKRVMPPGWIPRPNPQDPEHREEIERKHAEFLARRQRGQ